MDKVVEKIDFSKMDAYLLSGNLQNNPGDLREIYQKSFQCWLDTWNDFFHNEHQSSHKLNSNEFTRQDDVLALFYQGECFAITFFKKVHWDDPTAELDAYFNPWTPEAIQGLTQRGKSVLICSQFTVSKHFRKRDINIPWKYILSAFNMKRFLSSDAHAMTGTMRVKKGMGKMSLEAGGTLLAANVICKEHEEEPADLVAFFHEEVNRVYESNPLHLQIDGVWSRLNKTTNRQLRLVA